MKVIIVGCGRMGSTLAVELSKNNHEVTIVDLKSEALDAIDPSFTGRKVQGLGFDKDVLESVEIDRVDAVVACTSSDVSNALIGRIAKNMYRVPQVISRLYDPKQAQIYNMLGLQTISTTDWGIKRAIDLLNFSKIGSVLSLSDGDVEIIKLQVPELLVGKMVDEMNQALSSTVVCIVRNNKGMIPTKGMTFERGDSVYVSALSEFIPELTERVGL